MPSWACPAVGEGLFPGMAPFRLPRLVGRGTAARLILSGERLDADAALRIGLVDYVEPVEGFEVRLARIIEPLLAAPRAAVAGSKRLMREAFDGTWQSAYDLSLPLLEACLASPEVAAARDQRRRERAARSQPST